MDDQLRSYISEHLKQFPHLSKVFDDSWITKQLSKPKEQWSLITGWLARFEDFHPWLQDLDGAVELLQKHLDRDKWVKVRKKLRLPADRENTKGTLSEISLCVFLVRHNFGFEMEKCLDTNNNCDVDFSILEARGIILNVEMYWFGEADKDKQLDQISAAYGGMPYSINFGAMKNRIKNKIKEKAEKFSKDDITLLAVNCTDEPIAGGQKYSVIEEAFQEALREENGADYQIVDGVVWFELQKGIQFMPQKRGICLNPQSDFKDQISASAFIKYWTDHA